MKMHRHSCRTAHSLNLIEHSEQSLSVSLELELVYRSLELGGLAHAPDYTRVGAIT